MAEVGDIRKTSNNCQVARRVPRTDAGCFLPSNYIAAIDFGTTNCSVAYILPGEMSENGPVMLPFDGTFYRVPTAILFNPLGRVKAFGTTARRAYGNLDDEERLEYAFFEHMKMNLQHEEFVNREMKVKASNNKKYYLVEVIAHILKYLKDELIRILKLSNLDVTATDFDWVITVPAIWRAKGKQMMREAGYKAGLCSRENCPALKEVHDHTPERVEEEQPDKLSLALEPESAAIYCEYMSQKQSSIARDKENDKKSTNYLIVDIGGGTVDISAHCLVNGLEPHIKVIHPPTGNDCGGTKVNDKFKKFLVDLVKDTEFDRFVSTENQVVNSRNQFVLDVLLNEKFELQKKVFGEDNKHYKGGIELPSAFFKTYEHDIMQSILDDDNSTVELVDQDLRISCKVMSSFFEYIVKGIIECISETLKEVGSIRYIYLVGGFGGTKYVERVVKENFEKKGIECIVPVEPAYAVVRGAALFKLNPNVIECRKVDATYGINVIIPFKAGLHDPKYRWIDDDNTPRCENIFKTVVEKGDIVGTGEVFLATFCPASHDQKSMEIKFYSSQDKDIFYVTGEWGIGVCKAQHNVTKIGQIIIQMPVPEGDKERGVDVTFCFSHTEIKVRAYDRTSKNEVKVVFDFLTTE